MMLAPASQARRASAAISAGVTGTLCWRGSVSTPFSEQVTRTLDMGIPFGDQPPGTDAARARCQAGRVVSRSDQAMTGGAISSRAFSTAASWMA